MKWRTKPVEVEAFCLGHHERPAWYNEMCRNRMTSYHMDMYGGIASIVKTSDGSVVASQGDWLVRGPYGAVRVLKDSDFTSMYEEVVE